MTDILIDARRGAGSSLEILYGTVTWKPTLTHSRGTSIVLPAPTTYDLVDGQVVATNVQPTPEPVAGQIEWAYEVTFKDRHGKTFSFLVGVPDSTSQVNFISLPRYFETKPPLFGQGPQGDPGESATVAVGTVTGGTTAQVNNSGTNTDAVLDFVLPEGPQGPAGAGVNNAYNNKVYSDPPSSYPFGLTLGLYTAGVGGWPHEKVGVTYNSFVSVLTFRHPTYPSASYQIISGYQVRGATVTRQALTNEVWAAEQTIAYTDVATTTADGLMSSADKSKLDNVGEVSYNTKTPSSAPSTYPTGSSSGVMRVDGGWPAISGAAFTLITTNKAPSFYNSAVQWASPHFSTDSANKDTTPVLYRIGTNVDTWGEWQTIVTDTSIEEHTSTSTLNYESFTAATADNANKSLVVVGDHTVTGNIPNFWTIAFEGKGTITRGANTFTINPLYSLGTVTTNNLYVDANTGDDANDGLSPDYALKTIVRVQERLSHLTEDQAGGARWVVNLKGTFNGGTKFARLQRFRFGLVFQGEVGASPMTTIQRGESSAAIGLHFEPGTASVEVKNIRFTGFNSSLGYAVLMKYGGWLKISDCVADNCTMGFSAIQNVSFYFKNCSTTSTVPNGFRVQYSASGTFDNCTATGSSSMGFSVSRNSVVHIDYCNIISCNVGVLVDMAARANVLESNFKKNDVGVSVRGAAEWINASSIFNVGTADANFNDYEHMGVGRETRLYSENARNEFKIGDAWTANSSYQTPKVVTGSTSNTLVYLGTGLGALPENFFTSRGKRLRVVVYGLATLSADATLKLYAQDSGGGVTLLGSKIIKSVANASGFQNEFTVWARTANTQSISSSLVTNNNGSSTHWEESSADFSVQRNLRVYVQLGNSADSVTFYQAEVFLMG